MPPFSDCSFVPLQYLGQILPMINCCCQSCEMARDFTAGLDASHGILQFLQQSGNTCLCFLHARVLACRLTFTRRVVRKDTRDGITPNSCVATCAARKGTHMLFHRLTGLQVSIAQVTCRQSIPQVTSANNPPTPVCAQTAARANRPL